MFHSTVATHYILLHASISITAERDLLNCSAQLRHWRTLYITAHLFTLLRRKIYFTAVCQSSAGTHYILLHTPIYITAERWGERSIEPQCAYPLLAHITYYHTYFHYCRERSIPPQCTKPLLVHIAYYCARLFGERFIALWCINLCSRNIFPLKNTHKW